jgi:hypothetical protein
MALIECPECHKEVSDKADACPHCGNPIAATKNEKPKDKSRRGCLVFILLLIGVAVLLSIIGGHEKTGEHEEIGEKGEKPTSASNAPETPEERKTEQATKPVPEPSADVVRCYLAYFDAFGLFLEGWGVCKTIPNGPQYNHKYDRWFKPRSGFVFEAGDIHLSTNQIIRFCHATGMGDFSASEIDAAGEWSAGPREETQGSTFADEVFKDLKAYQDQYINQFISRSTFVDYAVVE